MTWSSWRCSILGSALALVLAAGAVVASGPAQRAPVAGRRGMVTSAHALASAAGAEILRRGGNAVDAAVATGFALAAVYPSAGSLGGGGFMLVHLGHGGDVFIDYREAAPAGASADRWLTPAGSVGRGEGPSTLGWRASGVPGTVAGFAYAHRHYGSGRLSWSDLIEPARRLAAHGHRITPTVAASLREAAPRLGAFAASRQTYLNGGKLWAAGDWWIQEDLAGTLRRLQVEGPEEFYRGETADRIARAMAENGGLITAADLAGYHARERAPLAGTYRGYRIVTAPPPGSGVVLLQMLGWLEPFQLSELGHDPAAKVHVLTEVMRRAFRDRAEYLGDPDFVDVPVAALLEPAYLASRMRSFDPERATPSASLPPVAGSGRRTAESPETTHFSVVDEAGNAVANTYTLNGEYGSAVTVPGTGILLNNQLDDFAVPAGGTNRAGRVPGARNTIAPGKRPASAMTPTIVLRDGRVLLVTGSPGGATIVNSVLQVITNVIDFGLPVAEAVAAPRVHHQWWPDVLAYEFGGLSPDTVQRLEEMGHRLLERQPGGPAYLGDAETILVDPASGTLLGAADARAGDSRAVAADESNF